jgi:hypothetical protein
MGATYMEAISAKLAYTRDSPIVHMMKPQKSFAVPPSVKMKETILCLGQLTDDARGRGWFCRTIAGIPMYT